MTKNRSTKRALALSFISLLLCVSMFVGTTFAWFTDSVTSANNIIKSGNLDVELEYAKVVNGQITGWTTVQGADEIFDPNALWEPGRVEVVYLKVSNLGTLALKYQLGVNVVGEIIGKTEAGADIKLSEHLVFKAVEMPDALTTYTDREAAALAAGTAKGLKDYNGTTTPLEVGGVDYVALIVYMPETVGNEANYKTGTAAPTIELGINLFATQVEAENDSFGSDYDKDAWHPEMTIFNAEDFQTAIANGVNAKLGADVEIDGSVYLTANLNLGGYTLSAEYITATKNVEIINGTIEMPDDTYLYAQNDVTITVKDVTFDSDEISAYAATKGTLVLKNVTFKNTATSNPVQNYGGTLVMDNVTVAQSGDANTAWYSSAVQVINKIVKNEETGKYEITAQANTTINSGVYEGKTALFVSAPGGNVTINGGTFTGSEYAINAQFSPQNYTYGANYASVITINGGDFTGALKFFPATEVVITGGTFTADPSAYVADGYKVVPHNGKYVVVADDVYLTVDAMQAAINAATSGVTIKMGADMTGDLVMKSGITIDGNGYKLNGSVNLNGADNVTLKNITFDAAGAKLGYHYNGKPAQNANIITGDQTNNSLKGAFNLVIDGCTFTGKFANGGAAIAFADNGRKSGYSSNITIKNCIFDTENTYYNIYGYYCGDSMNGRENFVIENNVFKTEFPYGGGPIALFSYASGTPVVVKDNTFETISSQSDAMYSTSNSTHAVSFAASGNTFAN